MKLYRFTASNTQRAITTVTETLGPEALVYSTRKIPGGVEVLAGLPFGADTIIEYDKPVHPMQSERLTQDEVVIQEPAPDSKTLEKLKLQIESMNDSIQILSDSISILQQTLTEKFNQKKRLNWDLLKKIDIAKLLKIKIHWRESTN